MKKVLISTLLLSSVAAAQQPAQCEAAGYFVLDNGYMASSGLKTFAYPAPPKDDRFEYLARFNKLLAAKGITLVMTLVPANMDGLYASDPRIKSVNPERLIASSNALQAAFTKAGVKSVDLFQAFAPVLKQNPDELTQFRRDGHWNQNFMDVAAKSLADYLKKNLPTLYQSISTSPNTLKVNEVYNRIGNKETGAQARGCPDFPLLGDETKRFALEYPSEGLLDDVASPVVLFGTSYSSIPIPGLGYDLLLAHHLSTRVENQAVNGGGPMGSVLNYFAEPHENTPKLILWEFSLTQLDNNVNPLTPLFFRQALPLLEKSAVISSADVTATQRQVNAPAASAIQIDLGKGKLAILDVDLQYANGAEKVKLDHTNIKDHSVFNIEMDKKLGALKSVTVGGDLPASLTFSSYK